AQRVVSDLVSIFEEANVELRQQATTELERIRAKLAETETQLQGLTPQRDPAHPSNETDRRLGVDPSAVRAQRLAVANALDSLGAEEFMLERALEEEGRQIAEQEKLIKSPAPASGLTANSAYGVLLARRAEVEGQIKDLSASATEKNPKMIQSKNQLATINREI